MRGVHRDAEHSGDARRVPTFDRHLDLDSGDLAAAGVVSTVVIPGSVSGFAARPAWVYLPPAALVRNPPALPVLVLLHGQPGSPR